MESAAACTISRALWLRDLTRMVSLVRCTMSLDAAPHGLGLKSSNKLQSKSIQAQKPGGFCFARPLSGAHVSARARKRYRKAAGAAHLSHCHRKSTPPYARAAERAQALDVHCVLDPSNPSNPSDGAPLDQLCPSMRGCLSIRAAVNAHSAATHNKTSNAGTRSAARHQVAGQAQPPAAR